MIGSILCSSLLLLPVSLAETTTTSLPNSCVDLEDGEHWLKLLDNTVDNEYPAVNIMCKNGYGILDYNRDANIAEYFSSFNYWHYAVVGPAPNDRVNWQEWFLPFEDSETKFALSPDCDSCDYQEDWQVYEEQTTYWMTGNTFQCWWSVKGVGECEMDYFSYACYECSSWQDNNVASTREEISYDVTDPKIWRQCGECVHAVKPSFSKTPLNHDECQAYSFEGTFQPSLGVDGRYCMCTQQSATQYYEMDTDTLTAYQDAFNNKDNDNSIVKTSENNIVELYQSDFEEGTYRIKESGYYKVMESIEFDFNNPSKDVSGNMYDIDNPMDGWMPNVDQSDKYPGAGAYRDNYFLGFFAGITIECDDVVLDLNGFELKQSKAFYYSQRWFSTVELASAMFLPGQGNGFFGNEFGVATNTIIKNGILGLTSHFGIHGNNNENIYLEDLHIRHFETHGIHMNSFSNVNMNNLEIGPASKIVYLKPEFGEAKYLLPRLRHLADEKPDVEMDFYGRDESVTMSDIADELEMQLNYAFWYAMNMHDLIDFGSEAWHSSKKLFINNEGMTSTSGLHGIFLNTIASPVLFTYRLSTEEYSHTVNIENVKIHGLTHAMDEWIRFHHYGEEIWWNAFMGPIDARSAIDNIDKLDEDVRYKGDIVIDSYIALNYLGYDNWDILGRQALGDGTLVNWALGTNTDLANNNDPYTIDIDNILIGCNCDAQLHSGKGVLGLRIDSVQDVSIKNVEIYELEDVTEEGLKDCGAYSKFSIFDESNSHRGGGHFVQRPPMQQGFSGNMVQGISIASSKNVVIEDVYTHDFISHSGQTYGVSIWPGNDNVKLGGSIKTSHMLAGLEVDSHETGMGYNSLPNAAPEACGTRVVYEYSKSMSDDIYVTTLTVDDDAIITSSCISGEVGCEGSLSKHSTLGDESSVSADVDACRDPISAVDTLNEILDSSNLRLAMNSDALGDSEHSQYSWQTTKTTQSLLEVKSGAVKRVGSASDSDQSEMVQVSSLNAQNVNRGLFGLTRLESGSLIVVIAMCVLFGMYIIILKYVSNNNSNKNDSETKLMNKVDNVKNVKYSSMKSYGNGNYGAV